MNMNQQLFYIAEEQAGYFSLAQAKEVGIQRQQIYQGVKTGRFWRAAAGVYRFVQFPASRHEDLHIALLKAGKHAVVGFQSALYVYDLSDLIPDEIHLILPRTSSRRRPGIRIHTTHLAQADITVMDGLRITSVARTISDCAFAFVDEQQIGLAISQALQRGMATKQQLIDQAMRRPKRVQELILSIIDKVTNEI
jgi:predicted transcriptional regulator of viral defense system